MACNRGGAESALQRWPGLPAARDDVRTAPECGQTVGLVARAHDCRGDRAKDGTPQSMTCRFDRAKGGTPEPTTGPV